MDNESDSSVKIFSYDDDQPQEGRGLLIPKRPNKHQKHTFTPKSAINSKTDKISGVMMSVIALFTITAVGISGLGLVSGYNQPAAPIVTVIDPDSKQRTNLTYGEQEAFQEPTLFTETRDAFIESGLTFMEVDLSARKLRYFKDGILLKNTEILSSAQEGTWWDAPSGLYKLEKKDELSISKVGYAKFPWNLTFQSNYIIHGTPELMNAGAREESGVGGIRLDDQTAEELFREVKVGIPILVHKLKEVKRDDFIYQPKALEVKAKNYLVADIGNDTILASSGYEEKLPIASLTKLMTALVASENIDLDSRVWTTSPTFVSSLVPRLSERSSVSMYSLMQLLLVESSNEAAETIAGELGRDDFIKVMNAKARQLGLMDTTFADPSGLSSDNISSIKDLFELTKYIYENKKFIFNITTGKKIASLYVGDEFGSLINFNEVEEMENFLGGKVGETEAAGQTSISLHRINVKGEERIIAVILLGSSDKAEDVKSLLTHAQSNFNY